MGLQSRNPREVGMRLWRWLDGLWGRYDDLTAAAQAINPIGAAADPDRDLTDGTLLFDKTIVEVIIVGFHLSHRYKIGTPLHPHVHWMKTTSAAGTVIWQMKYKVIPIGGLASAYTDLASATLAVSDADTANHHAISKWDGIPATNLGISTQIICWLQRNGGTYAADAKLLEFDLHFQNDASGSRQEYVK